MIEPLRRAAVQGELLGLGASGGGAEPEVRIHLPPAVSPMRTCSWEGPMLGAKPVDALPEIGVTKRQVDFDTSRDGIMGRLPRVPIRPVASFPHRYRDRSARGGPPISSISIP